MAKAKGGGESSKKNEAGYAFKFAPVDENPGSRSQHGVAQLTDRYAKEIVPALVKEFGYKNPMEIPRVTKVVLNIGLGEAIRQPKFLEQAFEAMGNVSGQRPVVTRAKKSIAGFKLREGQRIGCKVTLRRQRMWDFLERLFLIALPRTRDFRGVSRKGFDGRGNFTLGVKELLIFPEVDIEKMTHVPGMNICIHTTARTDNEGRALLRHLGVPFREA
jgi:large subunit ribosomal protein L5